MIYNPIIAEVRRTRSALLKQCGNDLKEFVRFVEAQRKDRKRKTAAEATKRRGPA